MLPLQRGSTPNEYITRTCNTVCAVSLTLYQRHVTSVSEYRGNVNTPMYDSVTKTSVCKNLINVYVDLLQVLNGYDAISDTRGAVSEWTDARTPAGSSRNYFYHDDPGHCKQSYKSSSNCLCGVCVRNVPMMRPWFVMFILSTSGTVCPMPYSVLAMGVLTVPWNARVLDLMATTSRSEQIKQLSRTTIEPIFTRSQRDGATDSHADVLMGIALQRNPHI